MQSHVSHSRVEMIEPQEPNRYVYYRLYTADGLIEANTPVYANNDFLGRISAESVAPPRTVASLIQCLLKVEGLTGAKKRELFKSVSSRFAMDGSTLLSSVGNSGLGLSEYEPVALVVDSPSVYRRRNLPAFGSEAMKLVEPFDESYLYYRVYSEDGEVKSDQHFHTGDNSLGRISIASITPPHTIASLKSRLASAESIGKAQMAAMKLFLDADGEVPVEDKLFLVTDRLTGWSESRPIALVYPPRPKEPATDPEERKPALQAQARFDYQASPDDPSELSFKNGDIFDVINGSAKRWEVKTADGSTGMIPSNFVRRSESRPIALVHPPRPTEPAPDPEERKPVFQARARIDYQASPDDPSELSFKKGDIFDVINGSAKWWEVKTADGSTGIIPSNFVRRYRRIRNARSQARGRLIDIQDGEVMSTKGDELDDLDDWWEVRKGGGSVGEAPSAFLQKLRCVGLRAEALYDYRSTGAEPEEFSFSKGDTFDVLDNSERWWEVRKADGTTGTALSNCLRVLP